MNDRQFTLDNGQVVRPTEAELLAAVKLYYSQKEEPLEVSPIFLTADPLLASKRGDVQEEMLRGLILGAIDDLNRNPEMYRGGEPFRIEVADPVWYGTSVKEMQVNLSDTDDGAHITTIHEFALGMAQRLKNGCKWNELLNAKWPGGIFNRLVLWPDGTVRKLNGVKMLDGKYSFDDEIQDALPYITRYTW